jgi:hypothetical protein
MFYDNHVYNTKDNIGFAFKHRWDLVIRYCVVFMSRHDRIRSALLQCTCCKTKYCLLYVNEFELALNQLWQLFPRIPLTISIYSPGKR